MTPNQIRRCSELLDRRKRIQDAQNAMRQQKEIKLVVKHGEDWHSAVDIELTEASIFLQGIFDQITKELTTLGVKL